MDGPTTPPQVNIPQQAKECMENEKEGEDPVKGLSPKMRVAQMLHEFGGWAYPQGQETQSPVEIKIRDVAQEPLMSSPDSVQTLNDSTDDNVLAQLVDEHVATLMPDEVIVALMPDEDAATVKAENCGLDDVLILDGMEIEEFDQELEAMEATKLVNMAEEPVREREINKLPPVSPVLNGITAMPQYHKKEARAQLDEVKEIREARQDFNKRE